MGSPQPPDFPQLLAALTRELNARQVPFMLIGGRAYLERWMGEFAAVPGRYDLPHRLAQLRASAGLA